MNETRFSFIEFFWGLSAPYRGFHTLIFDSRLRALAVIPLLVSVLFGSVLTVLGIYWMSFAVNTVATQLGVLLSLDPTAFWGILLLVFLWPLALLFLGVGVYAAVRLIAAPFYSYLAEKCLVKLGARKDRPFVFVDWCFVAIRMLFVSLFKSVIFGFAAVVLFIFSFVPVLNVIATFGFVHMLSFDVSDYGFEALEWPLKKRFSHVRQNFSIYSGLACGLGLAMLVPGLNLVMMPAAVIGASAVLSRTLKTDLQDRRELA